MRDVVIAVLEALLIIGQWVAVIAYARLHGAVDRMWLVGWALLVVAGWVAAYDLGRRWRRILNAREARRP